MGEVVREIPHLPTEPEGCRRDLAAGTETSLDKMNTESIESLTLKLMKKLIFAVALALVMAASVRPAAAQDDAYRKLLSELLDKSGQLAAADMIMSQLLPMVKQSSAGQIPEEFWKTFSAKWTEITRGKMVDLYVPIYKKYLSAADLKQIVAFYESPAGKKLAGATPAIAGEGMQAGQQLGMEIVGEMMQEIRQQGK